MTLDVYLEIIRAVIIGSVLVLFTVVGRGSGLFKTKDWQLIYIGFALLFFGSLIDITDNFESLNKYGFIGDTKQQAFIEKVVGYLFGFLFLALGFWRWLPKIAEYEKKAQHKINKAQEKVSLLSGLLPICSNCKKIRDDQGYWQQVEKYLENHSQAEFTHGICPDCLKKLYPELADEPDNILP